MILCCGEALIDMLPRTSDKGEAAFAPYPGGAVFNTSIALGRLGSTVGFFSGLSNDMLGEMLTDALTASHVDSTMAAMSDRPTTVAFVKLVSGHATYAFYDENTAGRLLSVDDLPDSDADALFFGGISLVVEPCGAAYQALMQREASRAVTMIDPNIRPSFIKDEAPYRARIEEMCSLADIVKLSDEDLHWLSGDGDIPTLARDLIAKGAKLVCITEGAKGVNGYTADHTVFVASNRVDVVDTVGAGDTFNAGLLHALDTAGLLTKSAVTNLSEAQISDALAMGAKCAAVTVSRAGANPPWAHEL
jgi:fructokinase